MSQRFTILSRAAETVESPRSQWMSMHENLGVASMRTAPSASVHWLESQCGRRKG